jgi:hypothetical protein
MKLTSLKIGDRVWYMRCANGETGGQFPVTVVMVDFGREMVKVRNPSGREFWALPANLRPN